MRQLFRNDKFCINKELEPVSGFFDFLQTAAALRNELRLTARSESLPIVCSHRRPGTQHLLAKNLCFSGFRQSRKHPNNTKRKVLRSFTQIFPRISCYHLLNLNSSFLIISLQRRTGALLHEIEIDAGAQFDEPKSAW